MVLAKALLLTGTLLVVQPARAEIIAYDPFNQGTGDIEGTRSSGGGAVWPSENQNWDRVGNTGTIESNSLDYAGPLLTSGNHAKLSNTYEVSAVRNFGTMYGSGSNLWLSFLMQGTAENEDEGLTLYSGSTAKIFIGHLYANWISGNRYVIRDVTATNTAATVPDVTVNTTTHFFVVKLNITAESSTFTLYVDPEFSSLGNGEAPTGGSPVTLTTDSMDFDRIRISTEGTTVLFDEFRMGTTWADVSPTNSTVPEPSSLVLSFLLLGLGAIFGWRRRRRTVPAA